MKKYINEKFPYFLHGGDYNPEQWIDVKEVWDEDMRLMREANCNEMTVGIFSWAVLEPEEGRYDFSFLDEVIDKIYQNGGRVVLATPSGSRPRWLAQKYPEVLRVSDSRERFGFSGRHNHCPTSPIYREKVQKINALLAERYGKHPAVVAWHVSNEYSGECFCPLCQEAFRAYLRERYNGDIQALNKAYWSTFWSHNYDNFEQIEAPTPLTDESVLGLRLDWKRFVTAQTVDFMRSESEPLRRITPEMPVTTNMMTAFYGLDYNKFEDVLDVASWDNYPDWHSPRGDYEACRSAFWHDYFRALKGRAHMMMESAPGLTNWKSYNKLKRPGMDTLAALQAIAHGSDTVQYFQWRKSRGSVEKFHGAVVDHVGTNQTRVFGEIKRTGEILKKIDEAAGTTVKARVAILFDWENWWALDNCQGFQLKDKKYEETCVEYYKPFWRRGVAVDVIGPQKDFSAYDLVIAPMLYMTDRAMIQKIASYVEQGGTFYATYMLGMVNESDLCYLGGFPAAELKEVFGLWNEEIDSLYPEERGEITLNGGTRYATKDYAEVLHERGAKVLARYSKEFYNGTPAYTVNKYGKGKAYYQAFRDTGEFKDCVFFTIMKELGIEGAVPELPAGVTAHTRTDGDTVYLFIENYSAERKENIALGNEYEDMLTGEKVLTVGVDGYGMRILKR
ncbi:MAG: beta-galactosidase [Clostridia bacterium]|nr:beta-galactosidase [Clostridia bacterium]